MRFPLTTFSSHPTAGRIGATRFIPATFSGLSNRALVACLLLFLSCVPAICQSATAQGAEITQAPGNLLSRRLTAALEARKSSDPEVIGLASERVIALGLVEMAKLKLDKSSFDEAVKLCRTSLEYEDTPETRVELAIVSLYAKKPADAVEQASIAAERDPQYALAWNIKGQALLRSKDYAGAAVALGRSLELTQDPESIYALGISYLGLGEKQKAADTFSKWLAVTGDQGWSRVLLGRAYQEKGMPQEAESEFRTALLIDPRIADAHYYWALTLLENNSWSPTDEVRSQMLEELKIDPHHFLANYWLGYFASKDRKYSESDHYLRLAIDSNPLQPETWMFLGLNAQHRDAKRAAEAYFRKAIELTKNRDPKEHLAIRKAYFALGRILASSGRREEGTEFVKKGQELELEIMAESQNNSGAVNVKDAAGVSGAAAEEIPETDDRNASPASSDQGLIGAKNSPLASRNVTKSPQDPARRKETHLRTILGSAFNDLATAEALQEKYALAVKHYREAERWDSGIPGVQRNLGLAAFFVGDHAEAIRLLSKVIQSAPSDAHARAVLGLAYVSTDDFAKAAHTIAPIADRAAQDPQLGLAWAKSLAETGNKSGAAHALDRLEMANPNISVANLVQIGQVWTDLGDSNRAEQALHQALLVDPANADANCALGIARSRQSKPKEAADLLLAVLADHPDHLEARYQLGRALLQMGDVPEAIRYLEEVSKLQPARLSVHLDLQAAYRKAGRTLEADLEHELSEALKNRARLPRSTP